MTVTVYKSTDTSAPALTGGVGSLVALLDALLVNGYGSKAAQGWTKVYSGTNAGSYRLPSGTNQRYLDVADNGTGAANYARIVGYETMSALATGTGAFPTSVQISGGLYVVKSATADSTARPWFAYGNGKLLYLWIATDSNTSNPLLNGIVFGDITSYTPGDQYNTIIIAGNAATAAVNTANNHIACDVPIAIGSSLAGHYICRAYTGVGTSQVGQKFTNMGLSGVAYVNAFAKGMGSFGTNLNNSSPIGVANAYPNAADSGLYQERLWWGDSNTIRGEMPGIWSPLHDRPLAHLDTFSGTGALAGRIFECLRSSMTSGGACIFMETSNTW